METDANADGYTVKESEFTGTISDETQRADFVNIKNGDVDTGITLDTLPYILVFGLVMIAAVVMIMRKYRVED